MPTKKDFKDLTSTTKKQYAIQELWANQKKALRLRAEGISVKEIAELTNYSENNVRKIINSDLGRNFMAMIDGAATMDSIDLMANIKALSPLALQVKEEILVDAEKIVSLALKDKVASDLLDRAGYGKINKNFNANMNITGMSHEDLEEIKERAKELRNSNLDIQEAS